MGRQLDLRDRSWTQYLANCRPIAFRFTAAHRCCQNQRHGRLGSGARLVDQTWWVKKLRVSSVRKSISVPPVLPKVKGTAVGVLGMVGGENLVGEQMRGQTAVPWTFGLPFTRGVPLESKNPPLVRAGISVGREGFEPSKLSQKIYSLSPLAAWVPTRDVASKTLA